MVVWSIRAVALARAVGVALQLFRVMDAKRVHSRIRVFAGMIARILSHAHRDPQTGLKKLHLASCIIALECAHKQGHDCRIF